jgi:hypothetical protein
VIWKVIISLLVSTTLIADSLPLQGRKFGVEFNIARFVTFSDSWRSFSGGFSYFQPDNQVEIAIPWILSLYTNDRYNGAKTHLDIGSIDIHYRKFLGEEMNGFYLSGFTRATHLNGILNEEDSYKKTMKFGLGVGLGYRLFPKNQRYYWGAGLVVGRYLVGDSYIYSDVGGLGLEDSPYIIDIEFLKFGYAF